MNTVSVSVVLYNPDIELLISLITPFKGVNNEILFIFRDHSKYRLTNFDIFEGVNFQYFHDPSNPGFGAGHNFNFTYSKIYSKYFLVCNPDIQFNPNELYNLIEFLAINSDIGLVMPSVIYPNGINQRLAKLLPSPFTLLLRRIPIFSKSLNTYVLADYDYSYVLDVPFLSGCFLLFPSLIYEQIKGFDENFFMYFEDVDISRRVRIAGFRTVVYPKAIVVHDHTFKSLFNFNTIKFFFNSSIYYFNKWGWFIDKNRIIDNSFTLLTIENRNK